MLEGLRRATFEYFRNEVNPQTGLIADKTQPGSPSSIAAVGMALSVYVVAIERELAFTSRGDREDPDASEVPPGQPSGSGSRRHGIQRVLLSLSRHADRASGVAQCELSTVDTAILLAGMLTAASYFTGKSNEEGEIRELAESLYRRVDWQWALNGGTTVSHGWKPESGFLPHRWDTGYSEALILYALALGSPTFPIDPQGYKEWISTFEWKKVYGMEYLYAGPLFIHQMSHLWVDFRGIHDDFNREKGIDYFENTRRATYIHRQYGIENPLGFAHYSEYGWGLTASDGPGPRTLEVNGVQRIFFDYLARGAPFGPDDGTISPWAVVASLPFAPEIVIKTIRHAIERLMLKGRSPYGFDASFNPTYPDNSANLHGWVSPWIFGLNQGPILLMIENFQSELIWKTVRRCPWITRAFGAQAFAAAGLTRTPSN